MTNSLHDHLYDIAHFIDEPSYSAVMFEAADRIEQLEAALREIKDWNDNQDRRSVKIAAVIDAALTGERKR